MFHLSLLFFVFLLVPIQADDLCSTLSREVYIRDTRSLFLMENNFQDGSIRMRRNQNSTDQRWILRPAKKIGTFNIINVDNKYALDLNRTSYHSDSDSFRVTEQKLEDSPSQQWYINWDGTIVNGATKDLQLYVYNGNYNEENYLVAAPRNTYEPYATATRFIFEFPTTGC